MNEKRIEGQDEIQTEPQSGEADQPLLCDDLALHRCPFCGSDVFAIIHPPHKHYFVIEMPDKEDWSISIECKGCPACMLITGSNKKNVKESVVDIWNKRQIFT